VEWAPVSIDGLLAYDKAGKFQPNKLVRLTKRDGTVVDLKQFAIHGDSFAGHHASDYRERRPYVLIPIEEVVRAEKFECKS
jgi:hypothetical protein